MMTKLAASLAGAAAAPATKASRILQALAGARPLRPITIPLIGLPALMTLVGSERELDIEGEVAKVMGARGLEAGLLNQTAWEIERARRVLADAVLDADEKTPLGDLAAWGQMPKEVVIELWRWYIALSEEFDPSLAELTSAERAELEAAIEKKSAPLLRSFGVSRLATYLLTTAAERASSPTPRSTPGDSSPGPSS